MRESLVFSWGETMHIADNTHGLWGRTAIEAPVTGALDRNIEAKHVIIGAGFTGLSTALHLVEQGETSVVVVEASEIGYGASGRNAGLVNAGAWIAPEELPKRLSPKWGKRLFETLGHGPDQVYALIEKYRISCDPMRVGNLHCGIGDSGLNFLVERARQWRDMGVEVQLLDARDTARMVGSDYYAASLLDPRTGTIQPLSYARGLAHAAMVQGVRIHTQTAVISKEREQGLWHLKTAAGPVITAENVVVATNTRQEGHDDAWPQLQCDAIRMPYFNMATAPLPKEMLATVLPGGQGAWDTATVLSSYRLDRDGRLVYGSVGSLTDFSRGTHERWVRRSMCKLFPALKDIAMEYAWFGWIDVTQTHLPHLHQPDENVWAFGGYNGRGIAAGTVLGREMALMLSGRIAQDDMSLAVSDIRPMGFKRPREMFYETGAMAAHAVNNRF